MGQSPHKQLLQSDKLSKILKQIVEIDEIADASDNLIQIVNLICDELDFYYVSIYLLINKLIGDETVKFLVLIAGSGEVGLIELNSTGPFPKGVDNYSSLYGWVAKNHQARIVLDIGENAVRFMNPLLPNTRSEIALPLIFEGKLIGVLDIQSIYEAAFSDEDVILLQPITDHIAGVLQHRAT